MFDKIIYNCKISSTAMCVNLWIIFYFMMKWSKIDWWMTFAKGHKYYDYIYLVSEMSQLCTVDLRDWSYFLKNSYECLKYCNKQTNKQKQSNLEFNPFFEHLIRPILTYYTSCSHNLILHSCYPYGMVL